MVTKGIYLFWDKKYEQVIYAGRFTGRKRIKDHFQPSNKNVQKINEYVQNHPDRIESVIFCEFDDISDDDLNQLEMETIKLFKLNRYKYPNSHVFNFTDGGDGVSGFKHSGETKQRISESCTGKTHTEETKQKISESCIGRIFSEEHKQKLSEAHIGKTPSEETRKKISETNKGENNPMWNKNHSEETKKKMSENHPNVSGENNPNAKYTLWDITKCYYSKKDMIFNNNAGMNPRRCFTSKYNGKKIYIGNHLDFYTPELINDLINESLEVN